MLKPISIVILSLAILLFTPSLWAAVHYNKGDTDILLVGLAVRDMGNWTLEGVTAEGHYEPGFYSEGRLAFYLKGKIKGEYLLEMALDSDKRFPESFTSVIETERYYPIYGDASSFSEEVSSQGKLYVKLEKEDSYLHFGDYDTGPKFGETEFTAYSRSFHGTEIHYEGGQRSLSIIEASTRQIAARDVFPKSKEKVGACEVGAAVTLGSSGPYYLTYVPVVRETEKVKIEVRDRDRPWKIIEFTEQMQGMDYSIEYSSGKIMFTSFVPSQTIDGDPVYIVVDYEFEGKPTDPRHLIVGTRGTTKIGDKLSVGASYIRDTLPIKAEGRALQDRQLIGVDASLNLWDRGSLGGEYSYSSAEKKGSAFKLGATLSPISQLELEGYYKGIEDQFLALSDYVFKNNKEYNISARSTVGRLTFEGNYLCEYDDMTPSPAEETPSPARESSTVKTSSAQVGYSQPDLVDLSLGYRMERERSQMEEEPGRWVYPVDGKTRAICLGVSGTGKFLSGFEASVEKEDFIDQTEFNPNTSAIRASLERPIRISEKLSLSPSIQREFSYLKDGTTGEKLSQTQASALSLGIELGERISTSSRYTIETSKDIGTGRRTKTHTALFGTRLKVFEQLTSEAGYELNKIGGDYASTSAATSLALNYVPFEKLEVFTKHELRKITTSDSKDITTTYLLRLSYKPLQYLSTTGEALTENYKDRITRSFSLGIEGMVGQDLIISGNYRNNASEDRITSKAMTRNTDTILSLAYRPVNYDRFNALAKLRRVFSKTLEPTRETETVMGSVEGTYDLTNKITLVGKYAVKKMDIPTMVEGIIVSTTTDLIVARVSYNFIRKFDISEEYRILHHYEREDYKHGIASEIGYQLIDHLRIALGYNFHEYRDLKVEGNDYSAKGPYLKLIGQF